MWYHGSRQIIDEDKESHMPLTAADLRARHAQPSASVEEPLPDTSDWSTEPTDSVAPPRKHPRGFFPPSKPSLDYLNNLLSEREHNIVVPENPSQTKVSKLIDLLLKQPLKGKTAAPAPGQPVLIVATVPLAEATHTVIFEDGDYQTIKIERQPEGDRFMPGKLIIRYLSGPDNTNNYTGYGNVSEDGKTVKIWRKHTANTKLVEATKVLVGDPKAAALAYAKASGNCYKCDRTLTTPESLAAGIGPVCSGRGY
jgi:hypothetical protein